MNKMSNSIALRLDHITKEYVIHHEKPTLVEKFIKGKDERFVALNDITLLIKKGERVGIVGHNGSGKTTLLKIIAGITTPTRGLVKTYGKVVSLIDLEAGFHPDLTGIQNIYLNGMLLGMSKRSIDSRLSRIIRFADIRQFIDIPLYTYSSGMKLRLGFSIAIHSNPDTLILDEGFAVGDASFQKKTTRVIEAFFKQKKTIIVATQLLDFVRDNCTRVIILNRGTLTHSGPPSLIEKYKKTA
jgi:ABC-type polysaccharide/polyol phosphate transport system ATPase subunit